MRREPDFTHAGLPYLGFSHLALYVVRPDGTEPLTLQEWCGYVERSPSLRSDKLYTQHNIDRGRDELWQERGRARWLESDVAEWLHFRPAGVGYHGIHAQPPTTASRQLERLRAALPEAATLDVWQQVVQQSRYMQAVDGAPRLARWVGRQGQTKLLYQYEPPAVWMFQRPVADLAREITAVLPERRALCERIARDLDARVETRA